MIKTGKSLLLTLILAGMAHAGSLSYEYMIQVDTLGIEGESGYLDFQLNPGSPTPSDTADASLFGFTTDTGVLLGDGADGGTTGDVSGTLPGTVTFDNLTVQNDYNEAFTFGSFFDIFVTLSVPDITGTANSGSTFAVTLFDDTDANTLIQNTSANDLVEIDLSTTGNATVANNSPNGEATVSAVPEPASFALAGLGLAAFLAARRRKAA